MQTDRVAVGDVGHRQPAGRQGEAAVAVAGGGDQHHDGTPGVTGAGERGREAGRHGEELLVALQDVQARGWRWAWRG